MTPEQLEAVARVCHEANRAWCLLHGDNSQVHWEDAPENIRASALAGIDLALAGATPEQQHQGWCSFKVADGWVYGGVKDAVRKTHPCLVPYAELPTEQRAKDAIYIGVVRAFEAALL